MVFEIHLTFHVDMWRDGVMQDTDLLWNLAPDTAPTLAGFLWSCGGCRDF
jgi:hypothetical protein